MRKVFLLFCLLICSARLVAQQIQSPSEFLGYRLGEKFTPHHKVADYFKYIASGSSQVKLQEYGKTYEGRPLMVAYVASAQYINKLEQIQENNLRLSGIKSGQATLDQPSIVWLSYNVHGNEAASSETAMQTLFELADPKNDRVQTWLKNTIVIIDPCMNPDGRERYVSFYNSVANSNADPTPHGREHFEPWPGGRTNHYYFDLNRDWAWQTQVETQQRMVLYNQWMPHIHVDFHEQGIDDPYYFAPAAEPFHEDVTKWQREFQAVIGRNNARYFDEKGWLYFTKERFDLLYPSYGDTYPTYNGAIGMTYEQGGSGRAGLAVINGLGDTLTLRDRILHHHTTGLSTIEVAAANSKKIVSEFQQYFLNGKIRPSGLYRTYVVKGDDTDRIDLLAALLSRNGIEYGFGALKTMRGYNYHSGKAERFTVEPRDLIISAFQPKSVLLKVLFEPRTFISDSITYDITAWALPYAYGLKAYASKEILKPAKRDFVKPAVAKSVNGKPVAYIANWGSITDVKFLAELLKHDLKVRYSEVPLEVSNKRFNAGSLIITRSSNERLGIDLEKLVLTIARSTGVMIEPLQSGFMEKGADLGSDKVRYIRKPRIAVVAGEETSSNAFGEIWHFFEQQIKYPLSVIRARDVNYININNFDVIIYPNGSYDEIASEKMQSWLLSGGKLIAMENAVAQLVGKKSFSITAREEEKEKGKNQYQVLKSYQNRERENLQNSIPGAIYKVNLDNTHPLAYGFPDHYYTLKVDSRLYNFLDTGWNVGFLKKDNYVTGFVGAKTKKLLADGLLFGVQDMGKGTVIYMAENPLFRSFWETGKLLFSNAIFMVGN